MWFLLKTGCFYLFKYQYAVCMRITNLVINISTLFVWNMCRIMGQICHKKPSFYHFSFSFKSIPKFWSLKCSKAKFLLSFCYFCRIFRPVAVTVVCKYVSGVNRVVNNPVGREWVSEAVRRRLQSGARPSQSARKTRQDRKKKKLETYLFVEFENSVYFCAFLTYFCSLLLASSIECYIFLGMSQRLVTFMRRNI